MIKVCTSFILFFLAFSPICWSQKSPCLEYILASEEFVYTNYNKCLYLTNRAIECNLNNDDVGGYLSSIVALAALNYVHGRISDYFNNIDTIDSILINHEIKDCSSMKLVYNMRAVYNYKIENMVEALDNAKRSLEEAKDCKNDEVSHYYFNIAKIYEVLGELERAKSFYELASSLSSIEQPNNIGLQAIGLNSLGRVNFKLGFFKKAEEQFKNANFLFQKSNRTKKYIENKVDILNLLIRNKDIDEAKVEFNQIVNSSMSKNFQIEILLMELKIKNINGDYLEVVSLFENSLDLLKLNGSLKAIVFDQATSEYLVSLLALKEFEKSIKFIEPYLSERIGGDGILNPEFGISESLISLFPILHSYLKLSFTNATKNSTEEIFHCSVQFLNKIRLDINDYESKLFWTEKYNPFLSELIDLCYEHGKEVMFFELMEYNKSFSLKEKMKGNALKDKIQVDKDLLEEEKKSEVIVNLSRKGIKEELGKYPLDSLKLTGLRKSLVDAEFGLREIRSKIDSLYPEYSKNKYENENLSLEELQKSLKPDEIFIEYFVSDSLLYCFIASEKEVKITKLNTPRNEVQSLVEKLRVQINEQTEYEEVSMKLYDVLLKPIEEFTDKKKLIIVPDNFLLSLPFEVLSDSSGKHLLENYIVNYQHSFQLMKLMEEASFEDQEVKEKFLGVSFSKDMDQIAETRTCSNGELSKLVCSKMEVDDIMKLIGLNNVEETYITKEEFMGTAEGYNILHISSHACPDTENPELSRIYLKDSYVTNQEIEGLDLQADLAVLSACETGFGKIYKGEGAMTISKSFFQAGVSSTVVSLWKVDDCSTSDLMTRFYRELDQNKNIDESLRDAKLDFIKNAHPSLRHPYFWAGFVQQGLVEPVFEEPLQVKNLLLFAALGLITLGLVGFKFYRSRLLQKS